VEAIVDNDITAKSLGMGRAKVDSKWRLSKVKAFLEAWMKLEQELSSQ